jgi:hypothetical protein
MDKWKPQLPQSNTWPVNPSVTPLSVNYVESTVSTARTMTAATRSQPATCLPALPVQGSGKRFDSLGGTVLLGHHQPLSAWMLCLYFMGLNLPNQQVAQDQNDLQYMTGHLRMGIDKKRTGNFGGSGRVRRGLCGCWA